jgi:hypothetical protein
MLVGGLLARALGSKGLAGRHFLLPLVDRLANAFG